MVPGTAVPELVISVKLIVLACTGWLKVAVTVGIVAVRGRRARSLRDHHGGSSAVKSLHLGGGRARSVDTNVVDRAVEIIGIAVSPPIHKLPVPLAFWAVPLAT